MNNEEQLKKIKEEVLSCTNCPLYKERKLPVIGQGNHNAKIIFIGEAPGAKEDATGVPFCGRSGDFLNELLEHINLKREDVYIANIIKCRPPHNRDPKEIEIDKCKKFIERQIEIINPKIICSLGRHSMNFMMKSLGIDPQPISKVHGKVFEKRRLFIPFYHPAVAIYNSNTKEILKKDFEILKDYVN
ncbi:MAG: uracil-DNA glycosylase [Candidatus Pacebacteria bacterium]|nr:uracil-DNA glycosylase [Candidatus Paceibacterota bacterium]MDD4074106.1 uracil-DNA glycosylase [Candidatus Paceibacterota bacterium]